MNCDVSKIWEDLMEELEVLKNRTYGLDGKLAVLKKQEEKELIGRSPDLKDAMLMRAYFDLVPKRSGFRGRAT